MESNQILRYSRQIILDEIGYPGQEKLLQSKVLVIGAGGLGSPALYYLAAAGIGRLGLSEVISQRIATTVLLPAVGQGSIGIETRVDDNFTNGYVAALNDKDSYLGITAERAFLKRLEGGCQVPIGAYGRLVNGQLHFSGLIASLDGSKLLREEIVGSPKEAQAIGVELAERLLARGGDKILAAIRAHSEVIAEFNAKTSGNNGAGF